MLLRRFSKHVTDQNWFAVGLDVVVVVVGIFLGMQVTDWNDDRVDATREMQYLKALKTDFDINNQNFATAINEASEIIDSMVSLLKQSGMDKPSLPVEELNTLMSHFQDMTVYTDTDRTYVNMTGSGDLRLISDEHLKSLLANYYGKLRILDIVQQTHELELVETFQPYIIANLEYRDVAYLRVDNIDLVSSKQPDSILAVIGTREFRNHIVQKLVIMSDLISQYQQRKVENQTTLDRMKQLLLDRDH
ncbi:MAG: hypothetical protein ACI9N9_002271 [Enterobacterales bacterium]|jgi:hypothetical protein